MTETKFKLTPERLAIAMLVVIVAYGVAHGTAEEQANRDRIDEAFEVVTSYQERIQLLLDIEEQRVLSNSQ